MTQQFVELGAESIIDLRGMAEGNYFRNRRQSLIPTLGSPGRTGIPACLSSRTGNGQAGMPVLLHRNLFAG
jgi:hypothetical protein